MFNKARLKLTGWYLLIIMCVSLAFSAVIYHAANLEIERFAAAQRIRYERRIVDPNLISLEPRSTPPSILDEELLGETEQRILMTLILINLGILAVSGVLGFYLSGKTLSPIKEMVDEQYRFVSDASHELKTPITAIKTTLEVALRDKQLAIPEARETLSTSLEEVDRLQKLAEGLLALTKVNGIVKLTPISLTKVIEDAARTIQPLAKSKKIELSTKVARATLMLEPTGMTRALVAILDNAIKYSPKNSRVTVSTKVVGRVLELVIKDEGKGITGKDVPLIFDRFYRADQARGTDGYGLGLPIAKQIIEGQNGNIAITSTLNKGTVVTITLPYSAKLQEREIN